jgi:Putative adhesin
MMRTMIELRTGQGKARTAAWSLAILLAGSVTVHADERRFDQHLPADPHGIVEISNFSGRIDVTGWDQPQVSVLANLPSGVDNLDFRSDHGHTTIAVKPKTTFGFGFGGDVDLKVKVPRGSEVDVTAVSGDVISTGVTGRQRLKNVSGSIRADIAQADVDAKTVSGDVTLHGEGKPAELHLTTISGTIRLERAAGDVEANTTSGEISLQVDSGRSVRMRTISGDLVFRGSLAKDADVDAQTVSGDVKLHAKPETAYEYEVTTFSGDIDNCFNVKSERTSRYGPGERLSGSRGDGNGGHVRIKTMSGDVSLCDKP